MMSLLRFLRRPAHGCHESQAKYEMNILYSHACRGYGTYETATFASLPQAVLVRMSAFPALAPAERVGRFGSIRSGLRLSRMEKWLCKREARRGEFGEFHI